MQDDHNLFIFGPIPMSLVFNDIPQQFINHTFPESSIKTEKLHYRTLLNNIWNDTLITFFFSFEINTIKNVMTFHYFHFEGTKFTSEIMPCVFNLLTY